MVGWGWEPKTVVSDGIVWGARRGVFHLLSFVLGVGAGQSGIGNRMLILIRLKSDGNEDRYSGFREIGKNVEKEKKKIFDGFLEGKIMNWLSWKRHGVRTEASKMYHSNYKPIPICCFVFVKSSEREFF